LLKIFLDRFISQIIDEFNPYHPNKRLTYEDGLYLILLLKYYQLRKDEKALSYLLNYLDAYIDEVGDIKDYQLAEYNIDNILAGNVLFFANDLTKNKKYEHAINNLVNQIKHQPRTRTGNFWHKLRYPYQIWLDGIYMGQVFYLRYAIYNNKTELLSDIMNQVMNADKLLWDQDRMLHLHAYDETKIMQWADKESGRSPNVWSRSVGWFAMALVDIYELLGNNYESERKNIKDILTRMIEGLRPHLDKEIKMIYQIIDKPSLNGNYPETSGSAMIAYALIKGYRLKLLDIDYLILGKEIIKEIDRLYLKEKQGRFFLGGICKVAGLDNDLRDGSEGYYLSEPVVDNEIKGVAPYLYALIELALLQ